MKFLNKYELMEPVTSGAVETFVARDLASGERVIVHMFAGSEVLPDNPAVQWALQSLRGLAPTPMGSIIEGGRYEQTRHAYLVTKFPADPVALQHWIRFYTMQAEATQPTINTPVPGSPVNAPRGSDKPKEPVGEFTKAFFGSATSDVDSQSTSASSKLAENKKIPDPAENWSRKPAGAFTKEFLSGFDLAVEVKKPAEPASHAKEPRKPQSFTAEFLMAGNEDRQTHDKPAPKKDSISALFSEQGPVSSPLPLTAEAQKTGTDESALSTTRKSRTGEFTKFFRGPFGGQSTSGTPADMNIAPPPRTREKAGEFTQLFGSPTKSAPNKESGFLLEPAAPSQSGNFTELLGAPRARSDSQSDQVEDTPAHRDEIDWNQPSSQTAESTFRVGPSPGSFRETGTPMAGSVPPRAVAESTALFANEIAWDRPAPVRPTAAGAASPPEIPANSPAAGEPIAKASGASKAGATSVFTPPGGPTASPLPEPTGPSEYTRIISPPNPAPPEEAKPASPAAPGAPAFSLPHVAIPPLAMPHAPTPVMPQVHAPQPPHLQMQPPVPMQVPMPPMQAPQAPSAPRSPSASGAAAGQTFPYWPLIIVMNVLLILAVALILYFALKH